MTIKPSTALRNEYLQISQLAHRASILAAEAARLAGAPTFTQEDLDAKVEALLNGTV